jgi:hypothetical protein
MQLDQMKRREFIALLGGPSESDLIHRMLVFAGEAASTITAL